MCKIYLHNANNLVYSHGEEALISFSDFSKEKARVEKDEEFVFLNYDESE